MLYNADSERNVLGAMLMDNTLIPKIRLICKVDYFHVPENKNIYEKILNTYDKHGTADIASVDYDIVVLTNLYKSVQTTANWNTHLKIIAEFNVRRELIRASDNISNMARNNDIDIKTLKSDSLSKVNNITIPEAEKRKTNMQDGLLKFLDNLEKACNSEHDLHPKWCIPYIHQKTGGMRPSYTVLAARPSCGKTSLAMQLAVGIAEQGKKVLIFSLETTEQDVIKIMLSSKAKINNQKFLRPKTELTDSDWDNISRTTGVLSTLPITIFDNIFNIEDIVLKTREMHAEHGVDMVIIDHILLCDTYKNITNKHQKISEVSRQIKIVQQDLNIHSLVLAQLKREGIEEPKLQHLKESGSLEQDATNVWFLHWNEDLNTSYKQVKFIIAKQKDGARDIFKMLKFYGATQTFYQD